MLALEHLADGIASHRCLDSILNIRDVDLEARRCVAVHNHIQIRLTDYSQERQIHNARDRPHNIDDLGAFLFEHLQILAVNLYRKLALNTADCLFHVVGDRLRETPGHAWDFFQLPIHGGDQFLLVLMEHRPPLFLWLKIDEELGIREIGSVYAVVRPADLGNHLRYFGESGKQYARPVHHQGAFGWGQCWERRFRAPR